MDNVEPELIEPDLEQVEPELESEQERAEEAAMAAFLFPDDVDDHAGAVAIAGPGAGAIEPPGAGANAGANAGPGAGAIEPPGAGPGAGAVARPIANAGANEGPAAGANAGHGAGLRPLGCSKCHYAQLGCTVCKNPNYRPRGPRVPRADAPANGQGDRINDERGRGRGRGRGRRGG